MAKDFLTENNVAFTDYDVQTSLEKRQEMIEKSGQMGVPVIFVGDEMMIGFDKQKLASLAGIAS